MARKLAFFLVCAAFWIPGSGFALGLGQIKLNSALNQPMDAEIELVSATEQDAKELEAGIASADLFDRYGLERNSSVLGLTFNVQKNAGGGYVLKVRSSQSISEPFLSFLVEVNWSRGRLLREYTVLLDPPIFLPDESATAEAVAAPQQSTTSQVVTTQTATSGTVIRSIPDIAEPAPTVSPQPQAQPEAQVRSIAPQSRPLPAADAPDEYMVQRNDTLWEIAERHRRAQGVDVNQMMIGIFDANPNAFMGNINLMKAGVILRIPDLDQYAGIDRGEARAEVARQISAWQAGQARSAGPGRLRLIPADDVSEPVAGTSVADEATREALADASSENALLRDQVSLLQDQLDEQGRMLQLRDSEMAVLQQQLADQAAVDAAPVPDELDTLLDDIAGDPILDADTDIIAGDELIVGDDSVVDDVAQDAAQDTTDTTAALPPAGIPTVVTTPAPEASILDRIMGLLGNSMLWIAVGVVFLLMMAVVFYRRRSEDDVTDDWDQLTADGDALKEDTGTAKLAALGRGDVDDSFVVVEEGPDEDTAEFEGIEELSDAGDSTSTAELQATLDDSDDTDFGLDDIGDDVGGDTGEISIDDTGIEEVSLEDTFSSETAINLDQADPVAEADFHMAYGLYDQAADLVKKASEVDPDDRELKLKLLEIYFVWGNKDAFLETANVLHASSDEAADGEWDKILIMGKQICPDDELFSAAPGAAISAEADIDLELEATQLASVDLDMETGEVEALSEDSIVDLDLGDALSMPDDDDIKLSETGETLLSEDEMMNLGATGSHGGVEFDLGPSTMESPTIESPAQDTGIDLDIGEAAEPSGGRTDQTAEVEVDDLGLDLDKIGATGEFALSDVDDDDAEDDAQPQIASDAPTMIARVDETMALDDPSKIALDALTDTGIGADDDSDATARVEALSLDDIPKADQDIDIGATAETRIADDVLDLDIDDLTQAIAGGDTAEMPAAESDIFSDTDGVSDVDLDLGDAAADDDSADTGTMPVADAIDLDIGSGDDGISEPTATQEMPGDEVANDDTQSAEALKMPDPDVGIADGDAETMSEVGTKLDLARAYMDMGDPDGAASILREVQEEGDDAQKQEAQKLLDSLP